ncbi:Ribosomal protein S5 family protein [Hibiscus syriacus]|uniref:Ribosomal protein S5 family protein n=1 Tax=Hibiscus syriacus TaxID=106335 RepID=A0A6A2Z2M0_HIBSY|nr:Ribosomal protein S5 family protein [Hibiscus syriacus]
MDKGLLSMIPMRTENRDFDLFILELCYRNEDFLITCFPHLLQSLIGLAMLFMINKGGANTPSSALSGQMSIPKPLFAGHLSAAPPPHWHPLCFSHSPYAIPWPFSLSTTDPPAPLDAKEEHTQSSSLFSDNSLHSSSSSHCTFVLMENYYIPFFTTATTAAATTSNMGCSSNSDFTSNMVLPPYQGLQLPYRHPMEQAPMYPCFDFGVWNEQERRIMDPYRTKMARINRKLARQRSLSLQRNAASMASTQRLRVLLKKELKNSDVGSLGRIVLPKRETEANLPILCDKEGIRITLKDVYSNNEWTLKYKFWINNKSRMYVLENTGDFVRQNGMRNGDSLTLYEDESMNLNYSEQLKHKEPQEPNDLMMTLPMDAANNSSRPVQTPTTLPGSGSVGTVSMNFDDFYGGLDMLPDVNHYNFSL